MGTGHRAVVQAAFTRKASRDRPPNLCACRRLVLPAGRARPSSTTRRQYPALAAARLLSRRGTLAAAAMPYPKTLARAMQALPVSVVVGSPLAIAFRELLAATSSGRTPLPALLAAANQTAVGHPLSARQALEVNLAAMVVLRRRGHYLQAKHYSERLNRIRSRPPSLRVPPTRRTYPLSHWCKRRSCRSDSAMRPQLSPNCATLIVVPGPASSPRAKPT